MSSYEEPSHEPSPATPPIEPPPRVVAPVSPPAATSRKFIAPDEPKGPSSALPILLTVVFLSMLVGSWLTQNTPASTAPPIPPAPAIVDPSPDAPILTPVAPEVDLSEVRAEIAALAKKIDDLPKPEPAPAPDFAPIEAKIADLAKTVEGVSDAATKIDALSVQIADSEKLVATLRDELTSVKEELKAKPAAAPEATTPAASPAISLAPVADLIKADKYAEALVALKTLPANDARVQYFTAIATGLSTREWTGATEQIVMKGVALEKAGTPKTAEIDAAFADLTELQGKNWLAFYRQKAK